MWFDMQTWLMVLAIGLGGSICFTAAFFSWGGWTLLTSIYFLHERNG
jgi:hypothetical protein